MKHGIRSVAFPSISTGVYSYPVQQAIQHGRQLMTTGYNQKMKITTNKSHKVIMKYTDGFSRLAPSREEYRMAEIAGGKD